MKRPFANFFKTTANQNETIIVEINSEKVRENNLEVSKVKDVVLEVLENLRKADLDVFAELKEQSEERAQTKLGCVPPCSALKSPNTIS